MAKWYVISLSFKGNTPTKEEANRINTAMKSVDYDFPELSLTTANMRWREPNIAMQEFVNLLHHIGFSCEATYWPLYMPVFCGEEVEPISSIVVSEDDVSKTNPFDLQTFIAIWKKKVSCRAFEQIFHYLN
jgi:hypothetical protein